MKIHLSTLGGFGDSLMLSMPAKRLRELFPDSYIVCAGRKDSIQILGSNPYINELREIKNWYDFPFFSPNYDLVIDFKYGVRTFFSKRIF